VNFKRIRRFKALFRQVQKKGPFLNIPSTHPMKTSSPSFFPGQGISALVALLILLNIFPVIANTIPLNGLVGYWTGDGTAHDSSTVGNNGSFGGAYAPGAPTGGDAFNLATGKVVIPNNAAYQFTSYSGWSVGLWFNANGTSLNNAAFLGQDDGPGYRPKWFLDWGYTVFGYNNDFNFHVNDFNTERIFVSSQPEPQSTLTGWNQITVTIDNVNGGTVDFYLNGNAIGSASMGSYVLRPGSPLVLGGAEGFNYNGLMSDVVLYDRVLPTDEVAKLAAVPERTSTAGLLVLGLGSLCFLQRRATAKRITLNLDFPICA
jgi:hypothetical protein